jgi:centrosomal protein CEP290
MAEMTLQHKGLEELMATLKDGRGAAKVAEWHAKMEAVRLEDLRYKRTIERMQQQVRCGRKRQ